MWCCDTCDASTEEEKLYGSGWPTFPSPGTCMTETTKNFYVATDIISKIPGWQSTSCESSQSCVLALTDRQLQRAANSSVVDYKISKLPAIQVSTFVSLKPMPAASIYTSR